MKLVINDLEKFVGALANNYYLPDNIEGNPSDEAAWARIIMDGMRLSEDVPAPGEGTMGVTLQMDDRN